jgi:hypothetical protein
MAKAGRPRVEELSWGMERGQAGTDPIGAERRGNFKAFGGRDGRTAVMHLSLMPKI